MASGDQGLATLAGRPRRRGAAPHGPGVRRPTHARPAVTPAPAPTARGLSRAPLSSIKSPVSSGWRLASNPFIGDDVHGVHMGKRWRMVHLGTPIRFLEISLGAAHGQIIDELQGAKVYVQTRVVSSGQCAFKPLLTNNARKRPRVLKSCQI